jgi:hypothetical protein
VALFMLLLLAAKHTIKTPERSSLSLSLAVAAASTTYSPPSPNNEAIKMQQISSSFQPRALTAFEPSSSKK